MPCGFCVEDIASMVERGGVMVCEACGDPIDFGGIPLPTVNAAIEGAEAEPEPVVEVAPDYTHFSPGCQALIERFRAHAEAARG